MNKLKIRLIAFAVALSMLTPITFAVLLHQRNVKIAKNISDIEYYNAIAADFEKYRNQHIEDLKKIRTDNLTTMAKAKKQYETLLSQQPTLVAQHTTTQALRPSPIVQKTVAVSKPTTTRATRAS